MSCTKLTVLIVMVAISVKLNTLMECIAQHKFCLRGTSFSYLADHAMKTGHNINWNDVKIIVQDNFDFRLLYKETSAFKLLMLSLNTCQFSVSLNLSNLLLRAFKICSNWPQFIRESNQIKNVFTKLGYPNDNLLIMFTTI